MKRTLLLSLWLPAGMVVLALVRFVFEPGFGGEGPAALMAVPAMFLGLVLAWPGAIPLTMALRRLYPLSRPLTYTFATVLGPLTVLGATVGGLFGPIGIWIYAGVFSVPAWLTVWLFALISRRRRQ